MSSGAAAESGEGMEHEFNKLVGQTITSIKEQLDELHIETTTGRYKLYHYQDCCETVGLHQTVGSIESVLNSPVTKTDESSSPLPPEDPQFKTEREAEEYEPESETWSLFEIETENGGKVAFLWHGESNGYYSEGVSFEQLN